MLSNAILKLHHGRIFSYNKLLLDDSYPYSKHNTFSINLHFFCSKSSSNRLQKSENTYTFLNYFLTFNLSRRNIPTHHTYFNQFTFLIYIFEKLHFLICSSKYFNLQMLLYFSSTWQTIKRNLLQTDYSYRKQLNKSRVWRENSYDSVGYRNNKKLTNTNLDVPVMSVNMQ